MSFLRFPYDLCPPIPLSLKHCAVQKKLAGAFDGETMVVLYLDYTKEHYGIVTRSHLDYQIILVSTPPMADRHHVHGRILQ